MILQDFLLERFTKWTPSAPEVMSCTKRSIVLDWGRIEPFGFIADRLLFRLEKDNKLPPWRVVYSGGKTRKEIDNLAPRHPHKFRLKVIVEAEAVSSLADRAVQYYGSETAVYEKITSIDNSGARGDHSYNERSGQTGAGHQGDKAYINSSVTGPSSASNGSHRKWLESQWSDETWTNTETDGTSIVCFCMAVHCGYIKQVQTMLEERPELIGILNPTNGFSPLATAVRKGDINTVRFLLMAGADVDQHSTTGQTPLHLALLSRRVPIAELLLEKGADTQARDLNGLRAEHYAVDSGDVAVVRFVLDKGGDVTVLDSNGWTPLFRALSQGADTAVIEELVVRGSELQLADRAGLPLTSVARILTNRQGRHRDSVLRLVDTHYPHELAMQNFTRLTKKIYNVHTLFKFPSHTNKPNLMVHPDPREAPPGGSRREPRRDETAGVPAIHTLRLFSHPLCVLQDGRDSSDCIINRHAADRQSH